MDERLRRVPLFADLPGDDLAQICAGVESRHLDAGAYLFHEGDEGDAAYVVADGEVEIVVSAEGGRDEVIAVRGADEVIGEAALLRDAPRGASVRARTDAELLRIPRSGMDALLEVSPSATRALFRTLLDRLEETNERLRMTERMAQLGTLTAGVAHELNNPAAAVHRAADHLTTAMDHLVAVLDDLPEPSPVVAACRRLLASRGEVPSDALAISDAEDAVADRLTHHAVGDPWTLAGGLVTAGATADDVDAALAGLAAGDAAAAVRLAVAVDAARRLTGDIGDGARRLSEIVAALKSFSHLDRAPNADVDVHRGLDDTLTVLGHVVRQVRVVRDYDPDLPRIDAFVGALNQVWTNLVHNAVDALLMAQTPDPVVTLRTRRDGEHVVVEVEDNGPGIPEADRMRLFDAFFTTKPPGAGMGMGLHVTYRIVVREHRGRIEVASEPGRTVFRVLLPIAATGTA